MGNKPSAVDHRRTPVNKSGLRPSANHRPNTPKLDKGVQAETDAGELKILTERYDFLLTKTKKIEQKLSQLEQMIISSKENMSRNKPQADSEKSDLNLDNLFLRKRILPPTTGPQKELKKALFGRPSDEKRPKLNSKSLTNL